MCKFLRGFSLPSSLLNFPCSDTGHGTRSLLRGIRFRAAGRAETKNAACKSARRVSENLLGNSKSSLAVFYVEQVALNRHVSPQPQLTLLCLIRGGKSIAFAQS